MLIGSTGTTKPASGFFGSLAPSGLSRKNQAAPPAASTSTATISSLSLDFFFFSGVSGTAACAPAGADDRMLLTTLSSVLFMARPTLSRAGGLSWAAEPAPAGSGH